MVIPKRFDNTLPKPRQCTGLGGLMSYEDKRIKWSPCSRDDLYDYYTSEMKTWSHFCLYPPSKGKLHCGAITK